MSEYPKMNPTVKALWIQDLRANPHLQGHAAMQSPDGKRFCCLGRLSKLYADKHGCTVPNLYPLGLSTSDLNQAVIKWAGLDRATELDDPVTEVLANRNDGHIYKPHTFAQIADWIDKNL